MDGKLKGKELIAKFLDGEISENEIEIFKKWLEQDRANRRIFDEENELWQQSGLMSLQDKFCTDKSWLEISTKLEIGKKKGNFGAPANKRWLKILLAAASIACLIAIYSLYLWIAERKSYKQIAVATTTISTKEGEKAHLFLSDSTAVFLNSGSTLEYSADYNINDRKVKFSGEAYFNVKTNPVKPLIVQLGKMSVVAKGTRFNILSFENEDRIETTLEEGIIQVVIIGQKPIDIKSGQQIVYFTKTHKASIRNVYTETYTSWRENKLRFNDTPFEEVLRKIGRRYNVVFEVKNKDLLDLKYTATFIDESIEEVMEMLKTVSPITYKIYNRTSVNDKIYLKPKIIVGKRKTSIKDKDRLF